MGYFFYGGVLGFLFSSLFYIVALVAVGGPSKVRKVGPRKYVAELILVSGLTALVLFFLAPSLDWVGRFRIPIPLLQVLLGIGTGVLVRVWLTRFLFLYLKDPEPGRLTAWGEAAHRSGEGSGIREGGTIAATPEWIWTVLLLSITSIAILLPYLEDMIAKATSIKVGSIEVSIRGEQKSQNIAIMTLDRERALFQNLRLIAEEVPDLRRRLASDVRQSPAAQARAASAANEEFIKLYESTLYPALRCISGLIAQGTEIETVKADGRRLATAWLTVANSRANDAETSARITQLVKSAENTLTAWSKIDHACKAPGRSERTQVGPRIQDSLMFHWYLSYLLAFLDDRIGAIQVLERVGNRFNTELNWSNRLGSLYYDEDPSLLKAIEYYETAIRIAEAAVSKATRGIAEAGLKCPTMRPLPKSAPDLCYDWRRYRDAVASLKNTIAYTYARSDRNSLSRARLLAREALKAHLEEMPPHTHSSDPTYWARLDTYAYVTMMASARGPNPDPKLIACAAQTFAALADYAGNTLQGVMKRPDDPQFRINIVLNRYRFETYAGHRVLAARILALTRGGECDMTDKEYKAMEKGDL